MSNLVRAGFKTPVSLFAAAMETRQRSSIVASSASRSTDTVDVDGGDSQLDRVRPRRAPARVGDRRVFGGGDTTVRRRPIRETTKDEVVGLGGPGRERPPQTAAASTSSARLSRRLLDSVLAARRWRGREDAFAGGSFRRVDDGVSHYRVDRVRGVVVEVDDRLGLAVAGHGKVLDENAPATTGFAGSEPPRVNPAQHGLRRHLQGVCCFICGEIRRLLVHRRPPRTKDIEGHYAPLKRRV